MEDLENSATDQLPSSTTPDIIDSHPGGPSTSSIALDICKRGDVAKNRWEVIEKLGAGTFGQVYRVRDIKSNKERALKTELNNTDTLRREVFISKAMMGCTHVAAFFACGHEEKFSFMVSELLGDDLAKKKRASQDGRLPLRTVVRIGIQCLDALEELHLAGFLHRDVKPANLAIGRGRNDRIIFLIDFGLARKFRDRNGKVLPPRSGVRAYGTMRYMSYTVHQFKDSRAADDLWSLLYTLVDLHVGQLPWSGLRDMKRVGEAKYIIRPEELFIKFPNSWHQAFLAVEELSLWIELAPDYKFLAQSFNNTISGPSGIIDEKRIYNDQWDWDEPAVEEEPIDENEQGGE